TKLAALRAEAAEALGLRSGIAVGLAGGDTQCGTLGVGALTPGATAAIGGTNLPFQMVVNRPLTDPERRIWSACYFAADRWVVESNAGSVGEVLDWFARMLAPGGA